MTEIDQGVDCTRRLRKPRNKLRLERRWIYAEPDETYLLRLLEVPLECEPSCYTWQHIRGGGTLAEEVGVAVWFRAPIDNEDCKNSAVINVRCAGKLIDTAYITTTLYATPPEVLKWYQDNRTWPTPALDYWKYRATVIKTYTLYEAIHVDGKTKYIVAGPLTFPTKVKLFRVTHSYDCNGIYLQTLAYATYNEPIDKWFYDRYIEVGDMTPVVVDARTPFLKGEPVTLDEGAIIPFGWKPNTRRLPGLNVPYGTIWPADWKKGDPFPYWECCPHHLLEADLL